jgi:hypothetical protein
MVGVLCHLGRSCGSVVELNLFFFLTMIWRRVRLLRRGIGCIDAFDRDDATLVWIPMGVGRQARWALWRRLVWRRGRTDKGPTILLLLVLGGVMNVLLALLRGRSASK